MRTAGGGAGRRQAAAIHRHAHRPLVCVRPEAGQLSDTPDTLRRDARAFASAALAAVDPARLASAAFAHALARVERVSLLAVGKAAVPMARAGMEQLGDIVGDGLVIAPDVPARQGRWTWMSASHPVPDERSVAAARAAVTLAASTRRTDTLLVLLSGGASALMALPADGIALSAKQATTRRLLSANATIHEVNCVRKHLSAIKGGRLAAAARGSLVTLALSDVVGDDPSVIGSGPTVADPSTFGSAIEILERCGGLAAFPEEIVTRLRRGADGGIAETPKPGDEAFARASYRVIGSGIEAARGAARAAADAGYRTLVLEDPVVGEARVAAARWFAAVRAVASGDHDEPLCVISHGETTVAVRGAGRGGRNQEFVLALVPALGAVGRDVAVIGLGTDGVDGPTDAAGAVADSATAGRALARGLDPLRYLEANDSWSFFDALGDLVRTGPTGTNVGDVQVAVLARRREAGR